MPHKIEIFGVIGIDWMDLGITAKSVVDQLTEIEDSDDEDKDVDLHINSGGGFVSEAVQIYNRLNSHPGEVTVYIDALAASAATIIAMAGDLIVAPRNAQMMVHRPWGMGMGDADDVRDYADYLDMNEEQMVEMYAARTGLSEEEVSDLLAAETWMTAPEAERLGFVDEVTALNSGPDEEDDVEARLIAAVADYQRAAASSDKLEGYHNPPESLADVAKSASDLGVPHHLLRRQNRDARRIRANTDLIESLRENFEDLKDNTESNVSQKTKNANSPTKPAETDESPEEPQANAGPTVAEAVAAETHRVSTIVSICNQHDVISAELEQEMIDNKTSITDAQARVLKELAEASPNIGPLSVDVDEVDKRAEGVQRAIEARVGLLTPEETRAEIGQNEFTSCSLYEISKLFASKRRGNRLDIVSSAFRRARGDIGITHSTGDFPSILENIAHKSLLMGWDEQPSTFEPWTNRGVLTDFKAASRVALNLFPSFEKKPQGAEYAGTTITDRGVSIQLFTYGRTFGISRETIIDDDLEAISGIPRAMGRAGRRTIADLVYDLLIANDTFGDEALFHVDKDNLQEVDINKAGLQTMRSGMRKQKDPDSLAPLNIDPRYLLVSTAHEVDALELMSAETISDTTNVLRNSLQTIVEPRLDDDDPDHWYVTGDGNVNDTIEVAYLDGNDQPFLDSTEGWRVDGVEFKGRIDVGVGVRDHRAMQKSTGAP